MKPINQKKKILKQNEPPTLIIYSSNNPGIKQQKKPSNLGQPSS